MAGDNKKNQKRTDDFNTTAINDNNGKVMSIAEAQEAVHKKLPSIASGAFKLGREEITPTKAQKAILREATPTQKSMLFIDGKAGTGKTLFSCYAALTALGEGTIDRICLATPAVTADEEIGFLPGDLNDKMMPHVRPMVETIDELIGKPLRERLMQIGVIEFAPHAFNRGRTYKHSFYLLDECQNATARQLRTSFSRIGKGSVFIYMGDDAQNDRNPNAAPDKRSAFSAYIERFSDAAYADDIAHVKIPAEDCKRHPLILKMMSRGDDKPLSLEIK